MKKNIVWIVFIILFLIGIFYCFKIIGNKETTDNIETKPVVKIGVGLPLSGNMANMGNAALHAVKTAEKDINSNLNNKFFYKLIVEDDGMNPKYVNNVANKFIHIDKVHAIVSYFSVAGRIVAPLAKQFKIINFICGLGDDVLLSKYNFQNFLTVDAINEMMIKFLIKNNVKEIDLIYQNYGSGIENLNSLTKKLKNSNIKYNVYHFNKDERDFSMLMAKIKNSASQAIFVYAFMPEADILAKSIRLHKINKIVAYNDEIPMAQSLELYEGFYNVGSYLITEELKKRFGLENKNSAYVTYMYDIILQIAYGFENAETKNTIPTGEEVSEVLLNKKTYKGIVTDYRLDEKGQFHSLGEITKIIDGKPIVVD